MRRIIDAKTKKETVDAAFSPPDLREVMTQAQVNARADELLELQRTAPIIAALVEALIDLYVKQGMARTAAESAVQAQLQTGARRAVANQVTVS